MSPEMRQAIKLVREKSDFSLFNQADEMVALRAARCGRLYPLGIPNPAHYAIQRFVYNAPYSPRTAGKIIGIEWNIPCDHCACGTRMVGTEIEPCEECGGDGWQLAETMTTDLHGKAIDLDV